MRVGLGDPFSVTSGNILGGPSDKIGCVNFLLKQKIDSVRDNR